MQKPNLALAWAFIRLQQKRHKRHLRSWTKERILIDNIYRQDSHFIHSFVLGAINSMFVKVG